MHYHFEHPELFDGVERPNFKALSGNIVIYGAGFQGLLTAQLLEEQDVKVLCFADIDKKKHGGLFHKIPVISPEEMKCKYPNAIPIVTPYSLRPAYEYVKQTLGYKNAVTPFSLFLDFDSTNIDKLEELPLWYHPDALDRNMWFFLCQCVNVETSKYLYSVDLSVTEICNLRCKNCNALMPCYEKPKHSEYEEIIKDLEVLFCGRTYRHVCIEGGEAFLWKDLPRLIAYLCGKDNLLRIYLYTNGTIIPSKELLDVLKNSKVGVSISDYGKRSRIDEVTKVLSENGVKYWVCQQKWFELASYHKNKTPNDYFNRVVSDCCKAGGLGDSYLSEGILYRCPEQGNLHKLGIFESNENEYVNLRQENNKELQEKIDRFINPKKLTVVPSLCHYCNGRGYVGKEVPPAEQLNPGEKIEVKFI